MNNFRDRMVVDGTDETAWLAAREGKIGGSDAAGFAKVESAHLYLKAKLHSPFYGNAYTAHGKAREQRMLAAFHIEQNRALFHAEGNPRHVCTPDGIVVSADGEVILAQAKTTSKPITSISPAYRRQMLWEQYVMGARRTLFLWEQHDGFKPLRMEPESLILERDDDEIEKLVTIANRVLEGMDTAAAFRKELER